MQLWINFQGSWQKWIWNCYVSLKHLRLTFRIRLQCNISAICQLWFQGAQSWFFFFSFFFPISIHVFLCQNHLQFLYEGMTQIHHARGSLFHSFFFVPCSSSSLVHAGVSMSEGLWCFFPFPFLFVEVAVIGGEVSSSYLHMILFCFPPLQFPWPSSRVLVFRFSLQLTKVQQIIFVMVSMEQWEQWNRRLRFQWNGKNFLTQTIGSNDRGLLRIGHRKWISLLWCLHCCSC